MGKLSNLEPGELIEFIGNTHVYLDHVEPPKMIKMMLSREP